MKTKPRRVDFEKNVDDLDVIVCARTGMFNRAIAARIGLTESQAAYRVWKGRGSELRRAWREGRGDFFRDYWTNSVDELRRKARQKLNHQ